MWAVGILVGAILGWVFGKSDGLFTGAFVGFIIGLLAKNLFKRGSGAADTAGTTVGTEAGTAERLTALEAEVAALKLRVASMDPQLGAQAMSAAATMADPATAFTSGLTPSPDGGELRDLPQAIEPQRIPVRKGGVHAAAEGISADIAAAALAAPSDGPAGGTVGAVETGTRTGVDALSPRDDGALTTPPAAPAPRPAWLAWILGGNTLARLGVLILFIGVGFLLKFAAEHTYVPVAVRLALIAVGGIGLLLVGWRLRTSRTGYAMAVQGGGVGVLYLTVFASLRLYALLPPTGAFALLFAITLLSSALALRQNALSLAVLAVVGGFLAPILTAGENGSHVLLFTYYALLNAGIFGIAWFKSWRLLNVIGFAFTFVFSTMWGASQYQPEYLASTEPFLILFFLFYVGIAVLYALRQSMDLKAYLDTTLVFGTPLVTAGLQSALVKNIPYAMAISALVIGAVYLSLASFLHARRGAAVRLLVESFIALGVVFASLAIPLALDARWSSAAWAVEGAAILWAGMRLQRLAVRVFALVLQLGAALAFAIELAGPGAHADLVPILNRDCLGALLIALSALYSARLMHRNREVLRAGESGLQYVLFAWGIGWWLLAGWREIERALALEHRLPATIAFLAITGAAFSLLERRLAWPLARVPALALLPILLTILLSLLLTDHHYALLTDHLFAHGGAAAWMFAVALSLFVLYRLDLPQAAEESKPVDTGWQHAVFVWVVVLLAGHELSWAGGHLGGPAGMWALAPWGLVLAAGLLAVAKLADGSRWPFDVHARDYRIRSAIPVAVLALAWSLGSNLARDIDPSPLPYAPLLNPLDIAQLAAFLALAKWLVRLRDDGVNVRDHLPHGTWTLAAVAPVFLWINALVLRSIHFWFDVPYEFVALWNSTLVQAALSLLWTLLALAAMTLAHRRHWRAVWMTGAGLLAAVVAKLFLVDLSHTVGAERIVSFIGVGLMLLVIGYFAPIPPRPIESAS